MAAQQRSHIVSESFSSIVATALDGFNIVDATGYILDVNDSYCRLLGYSREELVGRHISQVDAADDEEAVARRIKEIIRQGALRFESGHRHKNGSIIAVEVSCNYSSANGGAFFSFVRDITEQKSTREVINARLRLMEYSAGHTVEELLRQTLDEAEKLTGSCISFYHFLEPDQRTLKFQAWSTRTSAHFCRVENAGIHYPISRAGVWADCIRERRPVIHNDYASLPQRKGLPAGHAEVVRELVVPVFRRGAIVALLGVGNKPTDYLPRDVEMVSLLADMAWGIADRKRLESRIAQSEERYRNIVESQTEFVDRYLPGGIMTYVNPAIVHFTGVAEEELLGKSFYTYIHEDDRDEAIRRIESISRENPMVEFESKIVLPDGRVRWNRWTHTGFFDTDGELIEYQSVGKDITERKAAEELLLKEKAFLRSLIDSTFDMIYFKDCDGKYIGCNTALERFIGLPMAELIGKSDYDFFDHDIAESIRHNDNVVINNGETVFSEDWVPGSDGINIPFETIKTPICISNGQLIGLVGISRDVSERKRFEEALTASAAQLKAVYNNAPVMMCLIDTDRKILFANKAIKKFGGISKVDLVGGSACGVFGCVNANDDPKGCGHGTNCRDCTLSQAIDDTFKTGNTHRDEEHEITLDIYGDRRVLTLQGSTVLIPSGGSVNLLLCLQDITESKKATEKLIKKDAEIEQLLHTVAHDLRSPLVTIKTFLGYLEKDMVEDDTSRVHEDLRFINGAADKMKLMLDELLELSRIERFETVPVTTSLLDVVSDVVDTLAGVISERKVEIHLPEADVPLFGDRPRLCRIWQNLIENAIKYSSKDNSPQIMVGVDRIGEEPVFFVRDNGIGIETQYQDRIFGLFEKLDAGSPGVGLGLPMIRRIVEKCGGRIWAESEGPGRGASFNFTLPDVVLAG